MLYMLINLYTDSRTKETYNRLHLFVFSIFTLVSYVNNEEIVAYLYTILMMLFIGLIAEKSKMFRMGAGDTKMLIISALFLLIVTPIKYVYVSILIFIFYKMLFALTIGTLCTLILLYDRFIQQKKQEKYTYEFGQYQFDWSLKKTVPVLSVSVPATGGILFATILLTILL